MSAEPEISTPAPDSFISRENGRKYWEGVNADVDGMLGGIPAVSKVDLQGSRNFLAKLGIGRKKGLRVVDSALEGGAGIGRITRGLLLGVAKEVDVVEPISKFTAALRGKDGVRNIYTMGLEDWTDRPAHEPQYDLIWTQWCLAYLTDRQLVLYLERCKAALKSDGLIIIKENLSSSGEDWFDDVDSSITRQDDKFRSLFTEAGLQLVETELQKGLSQAVGAKLLPVRMYALRPV